MDFDKYILFVQIIVVLFVTPGTPRIVIMANSINYGFGKSALTALGDITANFFQMLIVFLGLGVLIVNNPSLLKIINWLGFLYLLYMSYQFIFENKNTDKITKKNKNLFWDGFLVAGLSPKAIVFFFLVFPNFIDYENAVISQFFIYSSTYVILDFVTLMIYAYAAAFLMQFLNKNKKTISKITGYLLIIFAIVFKFYL